MKRETKYVCVYEREREEDRKQQKLLQFVIGRRRGERTRGKENACILDDILIADIHLHRFLYFYPFSN